MAYRADVEFLDVSSPQLIERTAAEYGRLHTLLASCDDDLRKAGKVEWESEYRERYTKRLKEALDLAEHLSAAFRRVRKALDDYATAVDRAKGHFTSGQTAEGRLVEVMSREADAITPTARAAEPLRQWEDLRATTGFLDRVAELTVDVDAIREEAEHYYHATRNHYGDAERVESAAREDCVHEIRAALRSLPDFHGGDRDLPALLVGAVDALRREVGDAGRDPNTQLPGTGMKIDAISGVSSDTPVSPSLQRIRDRLARLPGAQDHYLYLPSDDDAGRRAYISGNKALINDAARNSGLPPEMVAGIAWREVEGDPSWIDEAAYGVRRHIPGTGEADQTSMGPIAIQVRRSAEVLGYDPENLTDAQREEVLDATKDPGQNIYIASEYLAQLKAESEFADVPPERMTREQMQELAARYNGGPYYRSDDAQAYGRGFDRNFDDAKRALES
ncbi:hypothetical protein ACM01_33815 [Streptomyces viridochromogenes]|uniref:Uncharacterized protein n=1 Tax=Streptomyces viridochromogenes TaxID=1938 RepID=A0A0J7Z352_STRVR|nr:hypothetical protein [Streptomyces viridochromogenes]KMS69683.1 hypothetical protein ACM01_33815 [Streptomyces viridochromogenes]